MIRSLKNDGEGPWLSSATLNNMDTFLLIVACLTAILESKATASGEHIRSHQKVLLQLNQCLHSLGRTGVE